MEKPSVVRRTNPMLLLRKERWLIITACIFAIYVDDQSFPDKWKSLAFLF